MTDYYDRNAEAFFVQTAFADMGSLYERFLPLLPERAHILDAGCGSGRDVKHFMSLGHEVTAIDASASMCALASAHTGLRVLQMRFEELVWQETFDGVWACASLLHLPLTEVPDAFIRLGRALKPRGVLYCSFKLGDGEREKDGRRFTDLRPERLYEIMGMAGGLERCAVWITDDVRQRRSDEKWLNAILKKRSE